MEQIIRLIGPATKPGGKEAFSADLAARLAFPVTISVNRTPVSSSGSVNIRPVNRKKRQFSDEQVEAIRKSLLSMGMYSFGLVDHHPCCFRSGFNYVYQKAA